MLCCIAFKFMHGTNKHENNNVRINYNKELHTNHIILTCCIERPMNFVDVKLTTNQS